jgi:NarL family two-component system response regulator YdfI
LFDTLRAAARGEALLLPEVISRALGRRGPASPEAGALGRGGEGPLTEREVQVLAGVAQGERSKEVAARLGITERTVKAHLASIYNKLGVDSRAAAVSVATQRGLLPARQP